MPTKIVARRVGSTSGTTRWPALWFRQRRFCDQIQARWVVAGVDQGAVRATWDEAELGELVAGL